MAQQSRGQDIGWLADQLRQIRRTLTRLDQLAGSVRDGAWRKPVHTTASVTADTGLQSLGARTNPLANNPIQLGIDINGNLGYIPSSMELKTVTGPYDPSVDNFLGQPIMQGFYDGDPTKRTAPFYIAEALANGGFPELVFYDDDGNIQGVRTETIVAALHAAIVKSRTVTLARIAALEAAVALAVNNKLRQVFTYSSVPALTVLASTRDLTITWPKPFADTDYTIVRSFVPPAGVLVNVSSYVKSQTTTGCVITIYTNGVALGQGGVMTVEGIHL